MAPAGALPCRRRGRGLCSLAGAYQLALAAKRTEDEANALLGGPVPVQVEFAEGQTTILEGGATAGQRSWWMALTGCSSAYR